MVWYASDSFDFGSSRQCLSKSVCGDDAFDMVCAYFRQAIARYINKLRIFVCGVCARHTGGDIKTINMNGKRMKKKPLYPRTKMIENELYGLRHHCHKYKNIPKWLTDLRYWKIFILSHFISRCNVRLLLFFSSRSLLVMSAFRLSSIPKLHSWEGNAWVFPRCLMYFRFVAFIDSRSLISRLHIIGS